MRKSSLRLAGAVLLAAALWFYMFSPWTQGRPNFWLVMCCSAVVLCSLALFFTPDRRNFLKIEKPLLQIAAGVVIAFALWGIFLIGDKLSAMMFDFARPEVNAV